MTLPIPARHPEKPLAVPALVRLFALLLGLREPTSEQWRRLGERLTVGDEPMDRLVEWMSSAGMQQMRTLFDRAAADGIRQRARSARAVARVLHWRRISPRLGRLGHGTQRTTRATYRRRRRHVHRT